jgi:hypothetical protein
VTATIAIPDDILEQIAQRAAAILAASSTADAELWLTVDQAATHLAMSKSQLYTLCSQSPRNGLPVLKEGSRSYFRASELDRWREQGGAL